MDNWQKEFTDPLASADIDQREKLRAPLKVETPKKKIKRADTVEISPLNKEEIERLEGIDKQIKTSRKKERAEFKREIEKRTAAVKAAGGGL